MTNEPNPGHLARCVRAPVTVGWGDCDPAGIAYFPRFFEWMDRASHLLLREMGITRDDMLPPRRLGLPLVAAEAQFKVPAMLDDELEVRMWINHVGRTSLGLRHEVHRVAPGAPALLATGSERRVYVGHEQQGAIRPRELSPAMRAVLAAHADDSSPSTPP